MILYLFFIILAFLISCIAKKTEKKLFLWIIIGVLTIAAGFRGNDVGIDTPNYYSDIVNRFPYHWQFREEGFRFISNLILSMTKNPQIVFILCAFVTNTLILLRLWDFRNNADFSLEVLLYLLVYYSNTLNIMRQYVAVSIIFYASRYLFKKKYVLFLLSLILASFFHRSALLGIIMFMIAVWKSLNKKRKKILLFPFVGFATITTIYVYTYLKVDISSYSLHTISNINLPFFYHILLYLFAWFVYKKNVYLKVTNKNDIVTPYKSILDIRILIFTLIGIGFESLSMFFAFVGRTGLYFILYEIVFWAFLCKNSKNKIVFTILIMIYAFYSFIQVFTRNSCGIIPYYLFLY